MAGVLAVVLPSDPRRGWRRHEWHRLHRATIYVSGLESPQRFESRHGNGLTPLANGKLFHAAAAELRELTGPTLPFTPRDPEFEPRVRASFARQAVMRTLDVTLERIAPGEVELTLPCRTDLTQQHGFLHAGVVTTVET